MKFTCGDRVCCPWRTHRVGIVQNFCVAEDSYIVKMDDGVSQKYFGYELEFSNENTSINKETKMSKKHKVSISYKDDSKVNVKMLDAANMAVVSQEAIEGYIDEGVNYLLNNEDEGVWYVHTGDTVVLITREEGNDMNIVVSTPRMCGYTEV